MVDQQMDDFDDLLLNQPWDPVSYFDEETGTQPDDVQTAHESDSNEHLTELFEMNLRSVEKDIKRMSFRKQETIDDPDLTLAASLTKEDGEESYDTIDRFINYEDNEDHLKAVDNTGLINQKNIESDIKRFAHFKQNSLQEDNKYLLDSETDFTESKGSIDDLVNLLPDAIQSEPVDTPNDILDEELDISLMLPDAVTEEPNHLKEMQPNDHMNHPTPETDCNEKLVDLEFDRNINKIEEVDQSAFGLEDVSTCVSVSGSSKGSADSINKVIQAAEEIVKGFKDKEIPEQIPNEVDSNEIGQFGASNVENMPVEEQGDLISLESDLNQCTVPRQIDKPDVIQIPEKSFAPIDLLKSFEVGNSNQDIMNRTASSLHDELLNSSPSFDLQEKNLLDVSDGTLSRTLPVEGSQVVRKKQANKKKRKQKRTKQKYVVDVLRNDNNDLSSTDSESEICTEKIPEKPQDEAENYDISSKTAIASLLDKKTESSSGLLCEENLGDDKTCPNLTKENEITEISPTPSNNEGGSIVEDNTSAHHEADMSLIQNNELSEEAGSISEQLADQILNEDLNSMSELQQSKIPEVDNVFQGEQQMVSDSDTLTDADTSMQENQREMEGAASARSGTRSGSTSDSEELEDFINQQLNGDPTENLPTLAGAEGGNDLATVPEEIQLGWYAPKWVPDKDAKACMNCRLKFTVVKRRHHCRACGQVLCSNCCNMKAELAYVGYKPRRVCQACYEILSKAQSLSPLPLMSVNQDVPGRGHTISLNESEPNTSGSLDSPPQYMPDSPPEYSVLPGSAVQSGPPNPPSYFASSGRGSGFRSRTESDRSVVIMFNSSQTDLPPVLRIENEVVKIINNPNLASLFQQIKVDCCIGKECWCFASDGMGASNQEEMVFLVEYKGDDPRLLKCVFQQFNLIFERAKHGEPLSDFGYIAVDDYMQNNRKNVGIILFKPNVQCVKNIIVPCHPHLFGLWIQETEVPWAKNLPLRLLIRLGAEFKSYPYPLYNLAEREPVFNVVGRTIIGLLADFRSFQYTLPRISGLLVSITKKDTTIKFPQTRYDEVLKVLNTSEENVMAFCGNFNRKADSHLVCVETDGTHTTQTISCRTTSKKLTGCSFVVFSAALKASATNLQAKTSIVEDGIMVQVTAETMKKIRAALKEMQDLVTPAGDAAEGSSEVNKLKIVWGLSDDSSSRTTSPIDGSPFDGLTNMRIRHSYDFTVSTSPAKIHWQEVYFLPNDADTVGRLSAKELSQMTSSVAKACMNALSPHLSTLVALEMTKIGLRMILDSDMVEYRIGSNKEQLPQELTGDLDDKLIPVIHSLIKTVSHRRVSAELIFQITRIV